MTLAYFCACLCYTLKEQILKAYISETTMATATLSYTVIQLGMVLKGRWNMWSWPWQKEVKTPWPTFQFSGSSTPVTWARTFIFGRCEAATAVCFLADLDLFYHCDTHLKNGLRPPSAYTAVVCLLTTAAFLVKYAVYLTWYDFVAYWWGF